MTENPLVSIIIITRNRPFLLQHCIERVLSQSYRQREIIVVDSSSNDESEQVVAQYPQIIAIRLHGQHNNMPQARNEGIARSSGEILAFIDDDSMVHPGWLAAMVETYQDTQVGGAGGRVIAMPEPYCDQTSGPPRLTVKSNGRVVAKDAGLMSTEPVEVDHLIGCNMSFRRVALEQVGGFDPHYTLTNLREETDLCVRVKQVGWRILFKPEITVTHFSARSLQPYFLERPAIQFSNARNCTYFAIKNYGLTPRTLVGQLIIDAGKSCGRAAYFMGLFGIGAITQIAGRVAGLSEGLLWTMSSQRRAAATPSIRRDRFIASSNPPIASIDSSQEKP